MAKRLKTADGVTIRKGMDLYKVFTSDCGKTWNDDTLLGGQTVHGIDPIGGVMLVEPFSYLTTSNFFASKAAAKKEAKRRTAAARKAK